MMRARFGHEKEYKVTVDRPVTDEFLKAMSAGVRIRDEKRDWMQSPDPVRRRRSGNIHFPSH